MLPSGVYPSLMKLGVRNILLGGVEGLYFLEEEHAMSPTADLWLSYLEKREQELQEIDRRIELMEFAFDVLEASDRF